ncbi:D-alanyl-D-alanine carboxypeptidase [Bradyrhizobium sp. USDA 4449]
MSATIHGNGAAAARIATEQKALVIENDTGEPLYSKTAD